MNFPVIESRNTARVIASLAFLLSAAAIAVHAPGHVSMDTSIQLYEASTGQSISWNPPFMSALFRWLGGGEIATTAVVFLSSVLIYGAFAIIAVSVAKARIEYGWPNIPAWRTLLAVILVLNPIVAIYVGIVWKDILFPSMLAAGCAFGIAAGLGSRFQRWACAALSVVLLAAALLIRQQGIFMAPLLLLVPIISLSPTNSFVRPRIAILAFACFAAIGLGLQFLTDASIRGSDGRSTSVGYRSIMIFDMLGIVSRSNRAAGEFAFPINVEQLTAVKLVYDPSRIDYVAREPLAEGWLSEQANDSLRQAWWAMLKQNPIDYIGHRSAAYATLLGLRGIEPTFPVHIGVDGNQAFLEAVGLPIRRDARDLLVYKVASMFFDWPIYRHAFWLLLLVVATVMVARTQLPGRLRASTVMIIFSTSLFYLSFLPTMISSDFRYLFGAIPLITIIWLIILLGASGRAAIATTVTSKQLECL